MGDPREASELAGKNGDRRIVPDLPLAPLSFYYFDVGAQQVCRQCSPYQPSQMTPAGPPTQPKYVSSANMKAGQRRGMA
jgi:hypothetical protein